MRVLNGPNLGRLGTRQPEVYGASSYADLVTVCEKAAAAVDLTVTVSQTDTESQLLEWLHQAADAGNAVVLNAAAWTHTSVAVRDAAVQLSAPWIEVHLSNVHAREPFRHHSYLSDVATGVICGLGVHGYWAAISWLGAAKNAAIQTEGGLL